MDKKYTTYKISLIDKKDSRHLTENLTLKEFKCRCKSPLCVFTLYSQRLLKAYQKTRGHFGAPIQINSGFRCQTHNKKVGGLLHSRHTRGEAIDMAPMPTDNKKLFDYEYRRLTVAASDFFDVVIQYKEKGFIHCHNH